MSTSNGVIHSSPLIYNSQTEALKHNQALKFTMPKQEQKGPMTGASLPAIFDFGFGIPLAPKVEPPASEEIKISWRFSKGFQDFDLGFGIPLAPKVAPPPPSEQETTERVFTFLTNQPRPESGRPSAPEGRPTASKRRKNPLNVLRILTSTPRPESSFGFGIPLAPKVAPPDSKRKMVAGKSPWNVSRGPFFVWNRGGDLRGQGQNLARLTCRYKSESCR